MRAFCFFPFGVHMVLGVFVKHDVLENTILHILVQNH